MRLGSTTIGTASAAITAGSSVTNQAWSVDFYFICDAAPATSAAIEGQGFAHVYTSSTAASDASMAGTGTTNVNTNANQAINLNVTWSAASASNTITVRQFIVTGM
jgi:hypothetical protein